jgi:hypothetical protein
MALVEQDFAAAPVGRRVIVISTVSAIASAVGILGAEVGVIFPRAGHPWNARALLVEVGAALLAPLVMGFVFQFQRRRASVLRLADNTLLVGRKSYSLEGLVDAARDAKVLCGAYKRWGNDGLGAIAGRFKSRRLGRFDAMLTDTAKAVVLRWPDKTLAVSPDDPEFFILMVRKSAGLR